LFRSRSLAGAVGKCRQKDQRQEHDWGEKPSQQRASPLAGGASGFVVMGWTALQQPDPHEHRFKLHIYLMQNQRGKRKYRSEFALNESRSAYALTV
jgi:hypothetical protein